MLSQANLKVHVFRIRLLQFEKNLDTLSLRNSASGENPGIPICNITPPFDGSSMGLALYDPNWETETAGDTEEPLNSEENDVISEMKSFQRKRKMIMGSEGVSFDHSMGSNLSSRKL